MEQKDELWRTLQKNPEKGFEQLVCRFQEPLYWHIRRITVCHDDAQDALQEAFVRIYQNLGSLKNAGALKSWLYRIATNEALRTVGRRPAPCQSLEDTEISADPNIDYSDLEALTLQRAINRLPQQQKMVFNLRYYDEMPYAEVATVLGISESAAKTHYHLAKEKVKEFITAHAN